MSHLSFNIFKTHEFVWLIYGTCKLESSLFSKNAKIEHKTIILENEARKLESPYETIRIGVTHIFVANWHVVLRGNIICQIVIHD